MNISNDLSQRAEKPEEDHESQPALIEVKPEPASADEKMASFEAMKVKDQTGSAQTNSQTRKIADDQVMPKTQQRDVQAKIQQEATLSETAAVLPEDQSWVEKAEQIIKENEDKPCKEQEDEEKLQQNYLNEKYQEGVK